MLDDLGYPYDLGHHPKIGVLKKLATSLVRPYAIRFFFLFIFLQPQWPCAQTQSSLFFFLFIFLQPHGHVPKHNHLSLSLSRSGTVQNNVSEGSPKIWRIQMNPIYPRFCSFKQLTHFRPCVHHKSRITC